MRKRAAVIRLDSVPPELLFYKLPDMLPDIKRMYEYCRLRAFGFV